MGPQQDATGKSRGHGLAHSIKCLTLQSVFNVLAVTLILLLSLGLVTCLMELQRLSITTDSIQAAISNLSLRVHQSQNYVSSPSKTSSTSKLLYKHHSNIKGTSKKGKSANNERGRYRRAALKSFETFDPLSSDRRVCYNLCFYVY